MKKKKTKLAALALVVTMASSSIVPAKLSYASEVNDIEDKKQEVLYDINKIEKDVEKTPYQTQTRSIGSALATVNTISSIFGGREIVEARIDLLGKATESIALATSQYKDKVQKAHIELGFGITRAVTKAISPIASLQDIKQEMTNLDNLLNKVAGYPKLQANDTATIYYKDKLDKAIWQVRFKRDRNILGKKTFQTYNNLNRAITKALGVQVSTSSTCKDVDQAIEALNSAYQIALAGK